jgi:hypothetical protein
LAISDKAEEYRREAQGAFPALQPFSQLCASQIAQLTLNLMQVACQASYGHRRMIASSEVFPGVAAGHPDIPMRLHMRSLPERLLIPIAEGISIIHGKVRAVLRHVGSNMTAGLGEVAKMTDRFPFDLLGYSIHSRISRWKVLVSDCMPGRLWCGSGIGGQEIARFDHDCGRSVVEFDGVTSLFFIETQRCACAPVELRLCHESVDDHLCACQRSVTHQKEINVLPLFCDRNKGTNIQENKKKVFFS